MELSTYIQIAGFVITALGAAATVAVVMAKLIDRWLQERFSNLEERLKEMHESNQRDLSHWRQVENDLHMLRAEMPHRYVLRDDDIRRHTAIHARIDALNKRD